MADHGPPQRPHAAQARALCAHPQVGRQIATGGQPVTSRKGIPDGRAWLESVWTWKLVRSVVAALAVRPAS